MRVYQPRRLLLLSVVFNAGTNCYNGRMDHSIQQYMVESSEQEMVEVSAYLTHSGVFQNSEWIRFRTSNEEFETNLALGLVIPIECPACSEIIQMPAMGVNDQGLLEFSQEGIEELERRGIEFS